MKAKRDGQLLNMGARKQTRKAILRMNAKGSIVYMCFMEQKTPRHFKITVQAVQKTDTYHETCAKLEGLHFA